MALLNLDKIELHRTVMGVGCPACAGYLEVLPFKFSWLRKLAWKKDRKVARYRCQECHRSYKMSEEL